MASELESSFQFLVDRVSFLAAVLLLGQSHDHMLPLLKVNSSISNVTFANFNNTKSQN